MLRQPFFKAGPVALRLRALPVTLTNGPVFIANFGGYALCLKHCGRWSHVLLRLFVQSLALIAAVVKQWQTPLLQLAVENFSPGSPPALGVFAVIPIGQGNIFAFPFAAWESNFLSVPV
jgi:hypothetical protein